MKKSKSNEKFMPSLHCIACFEAQGKSYKNLQDAATRSFISFCFY